MFFALFLCTSEQQSKKMEQQGILFCFAYTVLFRILDLKAVSQGTQPPVPHRSGHALWFDRTQFTKASHRPHPWKCFHLQPLSHTRAWAGESNRHGLKSQPCHFPAQWFAKTSLIFLSLSFLICQVRLITHLFIGCLYGSCCQRQCMAHSKALNNSGLSNLCNKPLFNVVDIEQPLWKKGKQYISHPGVLTSGHSDNWVTCVSSDCHLALHSFAEAAWHHLMCC